MDADEIAWWQKVMAGTEPVLDRMALAGWVTRYQHDTNGLTIAWTPAGREKMNQLLETLNQLCPTGFNGITKSQFAQIWAVVRLYERSEPLDKTV